MLNVLSWVALIVLWHEAGAFILSMSQANKPPSGTPPPRNQQQQASDENLYQPRLRAGSVEEQLQRLRFGFEQAGFDPESAVKVQGVKVLRQGVTSFSRLQEARYNSTYTG
jgi:hypothetical protein